MRILQRLPAAFRIWVRALQDPRTPATAKVLPFASLLYLLFPLDALPDILPLIGQTDDVLVILVLCLLAWRAISKDVKRDARSRVIDVDPKR